jgi:hypothetical protein
LLEHGEGPKGKLSAAASGYWDFFVVLPCYQISWLFLPVVTGYSINWDFFFEGPDIRLLNEIFRNRPLLHMDFDLEVSLKLRDLFNEPVLVRASARAIGFNWPQGSFRVSCIACKSYGGIGGNSQTTILDNI